MDIQPTNQQSISDDQELAKVLAGVNQAADEPSEDATVTTPLPQPEVPAPELEEPVIPDLPTPSVVPLTPAADSELDSIKKDALNELRPLVDKLDVSPEEKFDTYLLLLRSTDDRTLIAPAHDAAKVIADETRRAQALLDIIKEIDFLSAPQQ